MVASCQLEASHACCLSAKALVMRTSEHSYHGCPHTRNHICNPENLRPVDLSENSVTVLEMLTFGHFTIILPQLNTQCEGRPLSHVHHLWTCNHDSLGLCWREQSRGQHR